MRINSKKTNLYLRHLEGVTLLEVMIVLVIFLFISGTAFTMLARGSNSWQTSDARIQIYQEMRKCKSTIAEELRQAGYATVVGVPADGSWYNAITFQTPSDVVAGTITWDNSVQYLLGGLNGRQMIRRSNGEDRVLANEIVFFGIRRQPANPFIVEILLEADKTALWGNTVGGSIDFQVKLRN